ncbi:MAG TPA: hypothetical protein VKP14_07885 [Gaiellaceae bacterium]|nr:hypothetical protein [Gaiellaceae bacterium]
MRIAPPQDALWDRHIRFGHFRLRISVDTVLKMRSVEAVEFKKRCRKFLQEVEKRRHTIVVTKDGVPFVRVEPVGPSELRVESDVKR